MLSTVFVEINMQSVLVAECELKIITAYKSEFEGPVISNVSNQYKQELSNDAKILIAKI